MRRFDGYDLLTIEACKHCRGQGAHFDPHIWGRNGAFTGCIYCGGRGFFGDRLPSLPAPPPPASERLGPLAGGSTHSMEPV